MKNKQSVLNYIKIFEDYNQYFNEVSGDDYIDRCDDSIDFTLDELKEIRAIKGVVILPQTISEVVEIQFGKAGVGKGASSMQVVKLKDEWYLVRWTCRPEKYIAVKFYMCDQFVGLLKFIKYTIDYIVGVNESDEY